MADGESGGPLVPIPTSDPIPTDKTRDKLIRAIVDFMLKRYGKQIADGVFETLKRIPTSNLRELLQQVKKQEQAKLSPTKKQGALPAPSGGGGGALVLVAALLLFKGRKR